MRRCGAVTRLLGALGCLVLLFLGVLPAVAAPGLTASLDRDTVAVGESVTLTLTFEGVSPKGPPTLPRLPNLQVSYAGQSSAFSLVNGESTSSTLWLPPSQAKSLFPAFKPWCKAKP